MCGRYLFSTQEYKEFRQIVRDAQRRSNGQHNEMNFPMAGDIAPTEVPSHRRCAVPPVWRTAVPTLFSGGDRSG